MKQTRSKNRKGNTKFTNRAWIAVESQFITNISRSFQSCDTRIAIVRESPLKGAVSSEEAKPVVVVVIDSEDVTSQRTFNLRGTTSVVECGLNLLFKEYHACLA